MSEPRLRHSDDVGQADWIRARLVGFAEGVYSIVPSGFPAYVRLFHPAYDSGWEDRPFRWAEVARRAGTTMHALAQFDPLLGCLDDEDPDAEAPEVGGPDTGNLEPELLRTLCEVLGAHTTTPERCWFCLWHGYSWAHGGGRLGSTHMRVYSAESPGEPRTPWKAPLAREAAPAPLVAMPAPAPSRPPPRGLVKLPARQYLLFSGSIGAALDRTWGGLADRFGERQSPNLFWPDDHAWCVGTEIDLDSTYIGGSEALVEALLADERLETWRVEVGDPITADSDWINGGDAGNGGDGDPPPR